MTVPTNQCRGVADAGWFSVLSKKTRLPDVWTGISTVATVHYPYRAPGNMHWSARACAQPETLRAHHSSTPGVVEYITTLTVRRIDDRCRRLPGG